MSARAYGSMTDWSPSSSSSNSGVGLFFGPKGPSRGDWFSTS